MMNAFRALHWAQSSDAGGASGKVILLTLAAYADENGTCFPSQERIAHETQLSVRAVQIWLKKLEAANLISRIRGKKKDGTWGLTRYRLNLEFEAPLNRPKPPAESAPGPQDVVSPPAKSAGGDHAQMTTSGPADDSIRRRTRFGSEQPRELPVEQIDDDSARERDHDPGSGGVPDLDPPPDVHPERWREIANQVLELMELRWNDPHWTGTVGIVRQWLANGWDPDLDILPTVEQVIERAKRPIRSLSYFTDAIAQAYTDRQAAAVSPDDHPPPKSGRFASAAELQADSMNSAIDDVFGSEDDDGS